VADRGDERLLGRGRHRLGDDRGDVDVAAAGVVGAERVGAAGVHPEQRLAEDLLHPAGELCEVVLELHVPTLSRRRNIVTSPPGTLRTWG
jgi:hypothetical protein